MQIPIKGYKLLNVPAEPAVPNALYFILDESEAIAEIYLTDANGTLKLVGNEAYILSILAPLIAKASTAPVLLSSTQVNLNEGTGAKQPLYTVPANRRAIITRVDTDKLSADPTNAAFTMGWDSPATNTLDPFVLSDLVDSATKFGSILIQPTSWLVGTAGQSLGLAVSTPQGSALTARMNLFGYLTDTDGVPVPNIL